MNRLLGLGVLAMGCGALDRLEHDHPPVEERLKQTQLRAFTSVDGVHWTLHPDVMARGMDSLGLVVRPDGEIWVTAHDHLVEPPAWERVLGPRVRGLRFDGKSWVRTAWSVDGGDAVAFIDPQWHGDDLWFVTRSVGSAGDPVKGEGTMQVRRSPGGEIMYERIGVSDPSPVDFAGERFVFVTDRAGAILHLTGDPLEIRHHWAGVSVPFATVIDDTLWLLAQATVEGRRYPVYTTSPDGWAWDEWRPLLPRSDPKSCTSPVIGPLGDGLVLLCVDEIPGSTTGDRAVIEGDVEGEGSPHMQGM